jgi:predicted PurR-regulated permease PerM
MDNLIEFFQKTYVKRTIFLLSICMLLYLMKSLLTLFLMTFLFIFIVNSLQNFLFKYIRRVIPVKRTIIIVLLYAIFLSAIAVAAYIYIPVISDEITSIFKTKLPLFIKYINDNKNSQNILIQSVVYISSIIDISQYTGNLSNSLLNIAKNIGVIFLYFFLSSILSMFFMIEKVKIKNFMNAFNQSKISWIYQEFSFFGTKFANSFGKVIEAQIIISLANTLLSVIALAILRFPNLLGLGTMIFFFGLIPIAGSIISLVPLSIIAYSNGGFWQVLYIVILVAILHSLESYVLNPNIMSYKTKLPVFFTFLVLIVGEHFFSVWGLIVGLPLTIFVLDLLDAKQKEVYKPTIKKIKT